MARGCGAALVSLALLAAALAVVCTVLERDRPTRVRAKLQVETLLGGLDTAGFARATAPRPLEFPRDHGPHPEFRNEWWYFTGNLHTAGPSPRHFGYELTIFRTALKPPDPSSGATRDSAWATHQIYMAGSCVVPWVGGRPGRAVSRVGGRLGSRSHGGLTPPSGSPTGSGGDRLGPTGGPCAGAPAGVRARARSDGRHRQPCGSTAGGRGASFGGFGACANEAVGAAR